MISHFSCEGMGPPLIKIIARPDFREQKYMSNLMD
jgi:hypothetical protein